METPFWDWDFCVLLFGPPERADSQDMEGALSIQVGGRGLTLAGAANEADERFMRMDDEQDASGISFTFPLATIVPDDLASIRCEPTDGCGADVTREAGEAPEQVVERMRAACTCLEDR